MTTVASPEMAVVCPNCHAANKLSGCLHKKPVNESLIDVGLLCPDCGTFTHAYWTNEDLEGRRERLQALNLIYKRGPTEQRWQNYENMRNAFSQSFEDFQVTIDYKFKRREVQIT